MLVIGGAIHMWVPETFNTHSNLCSHRSFAVYCGLELDRKERALLERRGGAKCRERERETDTDRHRKRDRATERQRERLKRYVCEYDYPG